MRTAKRFVVHGKKKAAEGVRPPSPADALGAEEVEAKRAKVAALNRHPVLSISRAANVPNRAARRSGMVNSASDKRIAEFGKVRRVVAS